MTLIPLLLLFAGMFARSYAAAYQNYTVYWTGNVLMLSGLVLSTILVVVKFFSIFWLVMGILSIILMLALIRSELKKIKPAK